MSVEIFFRVIMYITLYVGLFTIFFYFISFSERKIKEKKIKEFPFVSIIIPAYNEEDALEKTVESVIGLNYPKDKYEIIIVDDGSKDNTLKIARSLARKSRLVRVITKSNGGKASAMNLGIEKSKGEFIVSFDSDSMVTPDALRLMIPYFEDRTVMSVTPAMKVYKPKGLFQRIQAIEYDLGVFYRRAFSEIDSITVTPGPFSAYRKEFFLRLGGYEVGNITEDMEIAMRMQKNHFKIKNCIRAVVYTIAPKSFKELTKQRKRWYSGSIKNFWKYRNMFFSPRYSELGTLILPLIIFSIISVILVTTFYVGKWVYDSLNDLRYYSTIGFDFVNNLEINRYLLMVNFYDIISDGLFFFSLLFLIVSLSILVITNKKINVKERPVSMFINYGLFMVSYSILFSFWWGLSIISKIVGEKIKW